jgi:hypothetical protein
MRDHRFPTSLCALLLATFALALGASAATASSAPQEHTTAGPVASAAKLTSATRRHKRAVHAARCRRARRRAAHSAFAHARAARCHRTAMRARHRRAAALRAKRRKAAQRHAAAPHAQPTAPSAAQGPAIAATSGAHGSLQGYNGFGAGSWPGADWRPYASSSPFNQTTDGAAVHPRSAQIVQQVTSWGSPSNLLVGTAGTSSDYSHPTYYAQPDDPIFTLHATQTKGAIEGQRIRIPDRARPAGGSDGHMTVVEPDGWEYDFWQVHSKPQGGGTLTYSIGGRIPIGGSGLDSEATASNFGNLAGMIRAQELAAGEINHALFIVLKCTSTSTAFGYGAKRDDDEAAYVYPATHGGSGCSGDAPPMGARFQLDLSDAQIDALAVPAWKKTIFRALARYGGYVGDTGGDGFGLMFESSAMYTSFGASDPLVDFANQSGIAPWQGIYSFNLASGLDWSQHLRVLVPPHA